MYGYVLRQKITRHPRAGGDPGISVAISSLVSRQRRNDGNILVVNKAARPPRRDVTHSSRGDLQVDLIHYSTKIRNILLSGSAAPHNN